MNEPRVDSVPELAAGSNISRFNIEFNILTNSTCAIQRVRSVTRIRVVSRSSNGDPAHYTKRARFNIQISAPRINDPATVLSLRWAESNAG